MSAASQDNQADPKTILGDWAEIIPHLVVIAEPDGRWRACNMAWTSLTRIPSPQLLQWQWTGLLHPNDAQSFLANWRGALAAARPQDLTVRIRCGGDEDYRWHLCRLRDLGQQSSPTPSWLATFTELPEQHSSEAQIRATLEREIARPAQALETVNQHLLNEIGNQLEAVKRLQAQADQAAQIIRTQEELASAELDLDIFMNLVTERILQVTPATGAAVELADGDDMVYRAAGGSAAPCVGVRLKRDASLSGLCVQRGELMSSADTASDSRVDAEACRKIGVASMVLAPLHAQGEVVGVLKILSVKPHAFGENDIQTLQMMAGLIGSAIGHRLDFDAKQELLAELSATLHSLEHEIEVREYKEQALAASEKRIRKILDSAYDAFVGVDSQGRVVDWNPKAEATFGWSRKEAYGEDLARLIIPEAQRSSLKAGMKRFWVEGQGPVRNRRLELIAQTRSGRTLPVEATISAIDMGEHWYLGAFIQDISERKAAEHQLRNLAETDNLTGLPNRNLFRDRLRQAMQRSRRNRSVLALMYLDLDGFKQVNDSHGHDQGDALLKAFSTRLLETLRDSDTLARLGGDEFSLIAEGIKTPDDAARIADKIVTATAHPFLMDSIRVQVGVSVGVAFYDGGTEQADDLLRQADSALYQAKDAGKHTYTMQPFPRVPAQAH